jgi:hypothetical protein
VPIGVAPVGAQESGSLSIPVRRAPPPAGSGKWPTAVLRRIASAAEVHDVSIPAGPKRPRARRSWYGIPVTTSRTRPATIIPPLE